MQYIQTYSDCVVSLLRNYWLNCESGLVELFQKEHGRLPNESDFDKNLMEVLTNLKNASNEEGKALSTLPPLIILSIFYYK